MTLANFGIGYYWGHLCLVLLSRNELYFKLQILLVWKEIFVKRITLLHVTAKGFVFSGGEPGQAADLLWLLLLQRPAESDQDTAQDTGHHPREGDLPLQPDPRVGGGR